LLNCETDLFLLETSVVVATDDNRLRDISSIDSSLRRALILLAVLCLENPKEESLFLLLIGNGMQSCSLLPPYVLLSLFSWTFTKEECLSG